MTQPSPVAVPPDLDSLILTLRGQKVLLDEDFAFQLTSAEAAAIRSQPVIASNRSQPVTASRRNLRYRPWAFTEHGALIAGLQTRVAASAKLEKTVKANLKGLGYGG